MSTLGYIILIVILFAVAGVLDTRRQKRLGIKPRQPKPKRRKADWVSDENYDKFLQTGDRNYLWKDDYDRDTEF